MFHQCGDGHKIPVTHQNEYELERQNETEMKRDMTHQLRNQTIDYHYLFTSRVPRILCPMIPN